MPTDTDKILTARLSALGLPQTAKLPLDVTITPEALALVRTEYASSRPEAASDSVDVNVSAQDLPRISIDERTLLSPLSTQEGGGERRDYAIVSTIGEGGMGRVHLARQRSLARDVALKTLKPNPTPAVAAALLREARISGALEHPGVIPIHMLGRNEAGDPILVMKRVNGVDLGVLLAHDAHPAWKARGRSDDRLVAMLEILTHVMLTLEFAHSRGIIHRDIKPENIMVGGFGEVYLLDWGIAIPKADAARATDLVGTPVYMAPEMALGDPIDERTDVYLLGATLHEMLTHRPRHAGSTVIEVLKAVLESKPVSYEETVPEELARICNRATAWDPSERYPSVELLREDVAQFLRYRSARALSDAAFERLFELDQLLAGDGAPKDLARAYRLVTEARFGFTQSLVGHDDETASSGMRRCIELAIDLELRQAHADSADALLREMVPPDPELVRRIAELRKNDAAKARTHERLAELEHHLDPTQQSTTRGRAIRRLGILFFVIAGVEIWIERHFGAPTTEGIMIVAALITVFTGVAIFVLRRRALANVFNQRVSALVLLAELSIVAHRYLRVVSHATVAETILTDLVIVMIVIGASAITLLPRLAACLAPLAVGLGMVALLPERALVIFVTTISASILTSYFVLPREVSPSDR